MLDLQPEVSGFEGMVPILSSLHYAKSTARSPLHRCHPVSSGVTVTDRHQVLDALVPEEGQGAAATTAAAAAANRVRVGWNS